MGLNTVQYLTAKKPTLKFKNTERGFIMYEGASAIDGTDIVVIATLKSSNIKTGNMVQTWILCKDSHPVQASLDGDDSAICGNCPHRRNTGGACYVNIGQAPSQVWKAYKRGGYSMFNAKDHAHYFMGRKVRLGSYGDPAAMPFEVAENMVNMSLGHTGYTHQAARKFFDKRFLTLCQVSADTPRQALKFQTMGAKTFRVALEGDALMNGEIECLSDSEGISCLDCGLCNGIKQNIAITVHGTWSSRFKSKRVLAA
jgi:hypothetical protein